MATQRHSIAAIALALACGLAAAGCTPSAEPTPTATATGFRSDDEAFAAAEATLRSYVDASNEVRLGNQESIERFLSMSTGKQRSFDAERLATYQENGYTLTGATRVVAVSSGSLDRQGDAVSLNVCLDVSAVDVRDKDGQTVVSPDRPDMQSLFAVLEGDPLRVSSIQGAAEVDACRS